MTPGLATASPRLPILAVALLTAAAANSQTPPPPSPIASGGATFLYLAEQPLTFNSPASILQFHADASGTVSPSNTLKLPPAAGRLAFTVDPSGQTYAAIPAYYEQSGTSQKLARSAEIVIYEPHASEAATPQRTITSGLLNYPQGIAVARSEELYVSDASGTIFVFSSAADGHSDPIRTIYGPATHLSAKTPPGSLAFDADGDLYVAAGTSILVFSPDADKNVAPIRTITAKYNACNVSFAQLGLDANENLYALAFPPSTSAADPCSGIPSIFLFARGADGDSTPIKTISAPPNGRGSRLHPFSFGVDRVGNVFTVDLSGHEVSAYGPDSSEDQFPASRIILPDSPQKNVPAIALQ